MTDVLLATIPPVKEQASTEAKVYSLDVTPLLAVGEIPASPVVVLIDVATGAAYPTGLNGTASFTGNILRTPTVLGLVSGHKYDLIMSFAPAAGIVFSPALRLEVPR